MLEANAATLQHGTSSFAGRVLRASGLTVLGFGGSQILRLLSNLVLTRLLMPEVFGLMTLITLLITGLRLFSDIGLSPSILRSPRGDDPAFLDTAWTLDVLRSLGLWLVASALAFPMAWAYDLPILTTLIPITALVLIVSGLEPTRIDTAARHLHLGRVIAFDLLAQVIGLSVTALLAYEFRSIWALVLGQVFAAMLRLSLMHLGLPGHRNRFRIEPAALIELLHFGKWLFLSTIASFAILQGDKLILSGFLSLEHLGIYNIGYFLASVPMMLGVALVSRLMIPLYREHPPALSAANFARLRRVRFALTLSTLLPAMVLALIGTWLVGLLYDPRYAEAGAILVLLSLALMPQLVMQSYEQVALSAGASGLFCIITIARGAIFLLAVLLGTYAYGLLGAILAQGVAILLSYPLIVILARRFGAWDPLHDLVMLGVILLFSTLILVFESPVFALIS